MEINLPEAYDESWEREMGTSKLEIQSGVPKFKINQINFPLPNRRNTRTSDYSSKNKLSEINEDLEELEHKFANFEHALKEINSNRFEKHERIVREQSENIEKSEERKKSETSKGRFIRRPRVEKIIDPLNRGKAEKIRIDNKIYECKNIPTSYFENIESIFDHGRKRNKTATKRKSNQNFISVRKTIEKNQNVIEDSFKITAQCKNCQNLSKETEVNILELNTDTSKLKNKTTSIFNPMTNRKTNNHQKYSEEQRIQQIQESNRMTSRVKKVYRYCQCCSNYEETETERSLSPSPRKFQKNEKIKRTFCKTAEAHPYDLRERGENELMFDEAREKEQFLGSEDNFTETQPNISEVYHKMIRPDSARTKKQQIIIKGKGSFGSLEKIDKNQLVNVIEPLKFKTKVKECHNLPVSKITGQSPFDNGFSSEPNRNFSLSKRNSKNFPNIFDKENNENEKENLKNEKKYKTKSSVNSEEQTENLTNHNHNRKFTLENYSMTPKNTEIKQQQKRIKSSIPCTRTKTDMQFLDGEKEKLKNFYENKDINDNNDSECEIENENDKMPESDEKENQIGTEKNESKKLTNVQKFKQIINIKQEPTNTNVQNHESLKMKVEKNSRNENCERKVAKISSISNKKEEKNLNKGINIEQNNIKNKKEQNTLRTTSQKIQPKHNKNIVSIYNKEIANPNAHIHKENTSKKQIKVKEQNNTMIRQDDTNANINHSELNLVLNHENMEIKNFDSHNQFSEVELTEKKCIIENLENSSSDKNIGEGSFAFQNDVKDQKINKSLHCDDESVEKVEANGIQPNLINNSAIHEIKQTYVNNETNKPEIEKSSIDLKESENSLDKITFHNDNKKQMETEEQVAESTLLQEELNPSFVNEQNIFINKQNQENENMNQEQNHSISKQSQKLIALTFKESQALLQDKTLSENEMKSETPHPILIEQETKLSKESCHEYIENSTTNKTNSHKNIEESNKEENDIDNVEITVNEAKHELDEEQVEEICPNILVTFNKKSPSIPLIEEKKSSLDHFDTENLLSMFLAVHSENEEEKKKEKMKRKISWNADILQERAEGQMTEEEKEEKAKGTEDKGLEEGKMIPLTNNIEKEIVKSKAKNKYPSYYEIKIIGEEGIEKCKPEILQANPISESILEELPQEKDEQPRKQFNLRRQVSLMTNSINILDTNHLLSQPSTSSIPFPDPRKSIPSSIGVVFKYVESQGYFDEASNPKTPEVSVRETRKYKETDSKYLEAIDDESGYKEKKNEGTNSVAHIFGYTNSEVCLDLKDPTPENTSHFLSSNSVQDIPRVEENKKSRIRKNGGKSNSEIDCIIEKSLSEKKENSQNRLRQENKYADYDEQTSLCEKNNAQKNDTVDIAIQCVEILSLRNSELEEDHSDNLKENQSLFKQGKRDETKCKLNFERAKEESEIENNKNEILMVEEQQAKKENHQIIKPENYQQELPLTSEIHHQTLFNIEPQQNTHNLSTNEQTKPTLDQKIKLLNMSKLSFCSKTVMVNESFKTNKHENVYSILINPMGFQQKTANMSKLEYEYNAELSGLKRSVLGNRSKNNDQNVNKCPSKNSNEVSQSPNKTVKYSETGKKDLKSGKLFINSFNQDQGISQNNKDLPFQKTLTTKHKRNEQLFEAEIVPFIQISQIKHQQNNILFKIENKISSINEMMKAVKYIMSFFSTDMINFINRLFTPQKETEAWFFYKENFKLFLIDGIESETKQQICELAFQEMFKDVPNKINDFREFIKMITGSPLLKLEEKNWNKIKNIRNHENIFGFAMESKGSIHRILGSEEVQENESTAKFIKLKKENGKCVNMRWEKFMENYKYPFIIGINHFYFLRYEKSKASKGNSSCFLIDIFCEKSDEKMQLILSSQDTSPNVSITVYEEVEENKFYNVGTGDASFISMKLRQGNHMLVFRGCEEPNISIACSVPVNIGNSRWGEDMESTISYKDEELIKCHEL